MRRTLTALGSTLLFALLVVASLPAFAANANITITYEQGDNPYAYSPADVSIQPGDSVTWSNPRNHGLNPAAPHPTRCHSGRSQGTCPWGTFSLDEGESHTETFPAEGTFVFVCSVHPYMEGTVTVGDGDPSQPEPSPEPSPEPDPSPEPEPDPSPEPEPTTSAGQTASPAPAGTTAPDEPGPDDPSPDASVDPSPDPDETGDDTPASEAPDDSASDDDVAAGEDGEDGEDLEPAADRNEGGGAKALASVLVLVTGGALWSVRRGG